MRSRLSCLQAQLLTVIPSSQRSAALLQKAKVLSQRVNDAPDGNFSPDLTFSVSFVRGASHFLQQPAVVLYFLRCDVGGGCWYER